MDNDPIVLAHARALLTGVRGETAYLDADIRDTATVLDAATRTLDFSRPIALMMIAVLHCILDEDDPWSLVRDLVAALPPGSYLALTHPGLDLVEPGLVRAPEWRPDSAADTANPAEMWSGIARKP